MPQYIVNRNAYQNTTGIGYAHEVHNLSDANGCLPDKENWIPLGEQLNCRYAVDIANQYLAGRSLYKADGCKYCATSCHNV